MKPHHISLNTFIYIILTSAVLTSCSVLKNKTWLESDSSFVQQQQKKVSASLKTAQNTGLQSFRTDSAQNRYLVTIIPQGEFSFSPAAGFSGKASSVAITATGKQWQHVAARVESKAYAQFDSAVSSSSKTKAERKQSTRTKELKKSSQWAPVLISLVAILVFLFLLRRTASVYL